MQIETLNEPNRPYGGKNPARQSKEPWLRKKRWTEEEYLALETNRLIEFNNGVLEILPMPDFFHQRMALLLANLLNAFAALGQPGTAVCAPFRMKTANGKYREPDVLFLFEKNAGKFASTFWTGADLVMEIVSRSGEKRDLVDKRADYAATGIAEYWIIDPQAGTITVLKLSGGAYIEHGIFKRGERANSALLSGFGAEVNTILDLRAPFGKP